MTPHRTQPRPLALAILATAAFAACEPPSEMPLEPEFAASENAGGTLAFDVYTQNLYLGGDTEALLTVDFSDIFAVVSGVSSFWGDVQASNIPERALEVVAEIEARMPHAVALQEAFRFIELDATFQPIGGQDFLAAVEAGIAARGLPYVTEVVQNGTHVTLPLSLGPAGVASYLDVTERVVLLRRSDVPLLSEAQAQYAQGYTLVPGVTLNRGWARMTVAHAGSSYNVLTTHLEVQQLAPIQIAQAYELRTQIVPSLPDGVSLLAGDFNSNAAASPGHPTWTPTYGDIVGDGFLDLWNSAPPANRDEDGLTCCHDKSLFGDLAFNQRIDFLFVRATDVDPAFWDRMTGEFRAEIVGEEDADRTDSGRWPSDHAGVVGSVRMPPGID